MTTTQKAQPQANAAASAETRRFETQDRQEALNHKRHIDALVSSTGRRTGDTWHTVIPYAEIRRMVQSVRASGFSHARARPSGVGYDSVLVYGFDKTSPSGVLLRGGGPAIIMDRLIRKHQRTSAFSPTERLA